jgi:hypothetical protein
MELSFIYEQHKKLFTGSNAHSNPDSQHECYPNAVIRRGGEKHKGLQILNQGKRCIRQKERKPETGPGQLLLQGRRRLPTAQPGTADSRKGQ